MVVQVAVTSVSQTPATGANLAGDCGDLTLRLTLLPCDRQ